jgi:transcription elongation GreA/GreB family factor
MNGLTFKQVLEYGMGISSFVLLAWIYYNQIKRIDPRIAKIETDAVAMSAQNQEVVRNNTAALQGQVEANNNVAHALTLISKAMDNNQTVMNQTVSILERHDKRAEDMSIVLYQIKAGVDIGNHKTG